MKMRKQRESTQDSTPTAVAVAALVAGAAMQAGEIIYSNIRDADPSAAHNTQLWRAHMVSACAGSISFVVALFLLEYLGKKSKLTACQSVIPWLPIVALTIFATVIHIPIYVVVLVIALYSPWAYSKTRAVH